MAGCDLHLAGLQATVYMGGVDCVHAGQNPPLDIFRRPLGCLLRPLEQKPDISFQLILNLIQQAGGTQQHCDMTVPPCGVHQPPVGTGKGKSGFFTKDYAVNICSK